MMTCMRSKPPPIVSIAGVLLTTIWLVAVHGFLPIRTRYQPRSVFVCSSGRIQDESSSLFSAFVDEIDSLQALSKDCIRRTRLPPHAATDNEDQAFSGVPDELGYQVIPRSNLSEQHVMEALSQHGALVVDVTDGGTNYTLAASLAHMWTAANDFFGALDQDPSLELPGMAQVEGGSRHAVVGYANYDNGSMQFLETRFKRQESGFLPKEAEDILDGAAVQALRQAYQGVADIGKDVVRTATAFSSIQAGAFSDEVQATVAASRLADEIVDDGRPLKTAHVRHEEGPVSMSPHRLCRYTNNKQAQKTTSAREVFGAHTDSSFATLVPVAATSGLEVYDEAAKSWYRPELAARKHWKAEQHKNSKHDPKDMFDTIEASGMKLPWHARYVVVMPGEFLQLCTRNRIPAVVHRVVAVKNGPSRLSAPILLRGRHGTNLDVVRYLGTSSDCPLLSECDGMNMEDIHSTMQ